MDPSHPNSVPIERVRSDEAKGLIEYCGFTNDMNAVYKWKGVVVTLPTYGEGMNRSLMEACASGKPIITTNIAGCREMVSESKNGFLVPIRNSSALASAMVKYIRLSPGEKRSFSLYSRILAENRFDIKNVLQVYDCIVRTDSIKR